MRTQPVSGDSRAGSIERRLRGAVRRGAPPQGARTLTAILPSGRVVWLRVDPALAPAAAANHLAHVAENVAEWRQAATQSVSGAIERLSRTVADDAERLSEARLDRASALRRRIVAGDVKLDRRLAQAADQYRSAVEKQLKIERATVRRLRRRDLWDKIVIATSLPLFAAYGQRGRPFAANNVALTLSLLIWLVGDEVVDALFSSEDDSPYPLRDTDAWSYVAPLGNLLAGWWLMHELQHERFITGLANAFEFDSNDDPVAGEIVHRYVARVPLARVVAPAHFEDFRTFSRVPAVATIRSVTWSADGVAANARIGELDAKVDRGKLIVTFTAVALDLGGPGAPPPPSVLGALEVAWMVDTAKPSTAVSPS